MYASAGNIANFTGVLVQRRYKPGEKYIQLLFRTTEGPKLSITRNIHLVGSLREGLTYHVQGPEFAAGRKTFIKEPTATPIKEPKPQVRQRKSLSFPRISLFGQFIGFLKRRYRYIAAAIILILTGSAAALVSTPTGSDSPNQTNTKKVAPAVQRQETDKSDTSEAEPTTTEENQPATTGVPADENPLNTQRTAPRTNSSVSPTPSPAPAVQETPTETTSPAPTPPPPPSEEEIPPPEGQ